MKAQSWFTVKRPSTIDLQELHQFAMANVFYFAVMILLVLSSAAADTTSYSERPPGFDNESEFSSGLGTVQNETSLKGVVGPPGPPGAKGEIGPPGPPGEKGEPGSSVPSWLAYDNRREINEIKKTLDYAGRGWRTIGNFRLWYSQSTERRQDANWHCESKGAKLLTKAIKTFPIIRSEIYDYVKQTGKSHWVSANDMDVEGTYIWSDGTLLSPSSPLWVVNLKKFYKIRDCVRITSTGSGLEVRKCVEKARYICELEV